MLDLLPLFADMEDLIKLGLFILFFVLPALGKLFQGGQNKPAAPRKPVPRPPGGGLAGKGQPAARDALEAEIDDFLKRAGAKPAPPQQRPGAGQRGPQPQPTARQPLTQSPTATQSKRTRPASQAKPTQTRPARRPSHELGKGVGEHVQEHIASDPVSDRSRQLGKYMGQSDERVEAHLHDVFDHDLGQLLKRTTDREDDELIQEGTDAATWESTSDRNQRESDMIRDRSERVFEMLRDPGSIRDAIIIGEILTPPKSLR